MPKKEETSDIDIKLEAYAVTIKEEDSVSLKVENHEGAVKNEDDAEGMKREVKPEAMDCLLKAEVKAEVKDEDFGPSPQGGDDGMSVKGEENGSDVSEDSGASIRDGTYADFCDSITFVHLIT